jgi:hypothetical protein
MSGNIGSSGAAMIVPGTVMRRDDILLAQRLDSQ